MKSAARLLVIILHPDLTLVGLTDTAGDRHAETVAIRMMNDVAPNSERLKNVLQFLFTDARPLIAELKVQVSVILPVQLKIMPSAMTSSIIALHLISGNEYVQTQMAKRVKPAGRQAADSAAV